MTRGDLEAGIWAITGRGLTGSAVDAILDLAEAYAAERQEHVPRAVLHHSSGTDLWAVIGVLADAMRGTPDADADEAGPPLRLVRGDAA